MPDADSVIPLFPLGLVLLPTERLPLHIFEDRYRDMIRDCLESDDGFGIINRTEEAMRKVGCVAVIDSVLKEYSDGRKDILTLGTKRFRVREVMDDKSYYTARVSWLDQTHTASDPSLAERTTALHMRLLELVNQTARPSIYSAAESLSFYISQSAGLNLNQKQEVLELDSEDARLAYLAEHFASIIPKIEQAELGRTLVQSDGHVDRLPDLPDLPDI